MSDFLIFFFGMCVAAVLLVVGGLFDMSELRVSFNKEAIQHNAAHHDPKTGAFTWNQ